MPTTVADMTVHVGADVNDAVSGLDRVDNKVQGSGKNYAGAAGMFAAGAGLIGGAFLASAGAAMNFDGAMADVSASLLTTTEEQEGLRKVALQIGQDTIFNATEGAQAIEQLGLAGLSVPDIMNGAALATANLAAATGEQLPLSANVMANAMTIFGISGDHATQVADTMTAALNESSLTLTDFQNGMASAGVMASAVGMSFEQTSGALALFSANGMSGADAGTALRSMLTYMANPTAEAAALFDQLGFSMQEGIDSGDLMAYTADKLRTGLAGMSEEERLAALSTMFGADAQRVANILYEEGAEGVQGMTAKMVANNQAQEASRRRMAGLRGAVESLKGSLETAAIVIGSGLTPILTPLAEKLGDLVNWFSNLPEPMIRIISMVAGVVGAFLGLAAAFASVMAVGGLIPGGFGAVAAAMSAVLGPILLLVAAAAALYVAWQANFLGIQDIVSGVFGAVTDKVGQITSTFEALRAQGFSPVEAGILALKDAFPGLAGAIDVAVSFVQNLVDAFQALQAGDVSGFVENIQDAFSGLGSAIWDAIQGIDWGGVGSAILSGLQTALGWLADIGTDIWNWLKGAVDAIPWGALWDTVQDVTGWIVGKLGDLGSKLVTWAQEAARRIPWGELWNTVGNITGTIVSKLGDLFQALFNWAWGAASAVPWGDLITAAAAAAGDIASTIAEGFGDLGTALSNWVTGAINSVAWGTLAVTALSKLRSAIRDGIPNMASIGATLLTWISGQLDGVSWNSLGQSFGKLLANGIKGVVGLLAIGPYLLGQVLLALADVKWSEVGSAFKQFMVATFKAITGFFEGVAEGLTTELGTTIDGIGWAGLAAKVRSFADQLWAGLIEALAPVINKVIDEINDLIRAFNSLPGPNIGLLNHVGALGELETKAKGALTQVTKLAALGLGNMFNGGPTTVSNPNDPMHGPVLSTEDQSQGRGPYQYPGRTPNQPYPNVGEGAFTSEGVQITQLPNTGSGPGSMPPPPDPGPWNTFQLTVQLTRDAVIGFVADTIGVMGGWVGGITNMMTTVTAAFAPPISQATSTGKQSFITFVADTIGVMGGWAGGIPNIVNSTMSAMQSRVSSGTSTSKQSFVTFVADTVGVMGGWVGGITNMVNTTLANMQSRVSSGTSTSKQSFITFVADTIAVMGGWSGGVTNIVSSAMSKMQGAVSSGMASIRGAIQSGMQSGTAAISGHASNWAGIINAAAGQMGAAGLNAGMAAGAGVANGLRAMLGQVQAAAAAIANAASAAMANALRVASPSKVTTAIGQFAGEGLALGIMAMEPLVMRQAAALANSLAMELTNAATRPLETTLRDVTGAVNGVRTEALATRTHAAPAQYTYYDNRSFTVRVDDLPELAQAAEFFGDLKRDRELVYGAS